MRMNGSVISVGRDDRHGFSKPPTGSVRLLAGFGIEGDVHAGATTRHRYLVKKDPGRPNLTQVHLIGSELFEELAESGFAVSAGGLGENITTRGLDLITLPLGTRLHLGQDAIVEVTGLRSPCHLINGYRAGLMKAVLGKDEDGRVIRKAGIMGVVAASGEVRAGDEIRVELPVGEHLPLGVV
jgi:MOSC domain-containing protein YiiM